MVEFLGKRLYVPRKGCLRKLVPLFSSGTVISWGCHRLPTSYVCSPYLSLFDNPPQIGYFNFV